MQKFGVLIFHSVYQIIHFISNNPKMHTTKMSDFILFLKLRIIFFFCSNTQKQHQQRTPMVNPHTLVTPLLDYATIFFSYNKSLL